MPAQTRKAIQDAFLKLAAQKPVDKITVKDIVEECQINRNSFYYHFEDMPNLIELTLEEAMLEVMDSHPASSLREIFDGVFSVFEKNRDVVRNIYFSKNREIVEYKMLSVTDMLVSRYLQSHCFSRADLDPMDEKIITRYYKCFIVGQITEWMNNGMRYDIRQEFERLCDLREGSLERMIELAQATRPAAGHSEKSQ